MSTTIICSRNISPDGQRLATIDQAGTAKVWDATSGRELLSFATGSAGNYRGTALAYYALMLATGGSALAMMRVRPDGLWPLLAFWLIAYGAIYAAIDRAWMRHRVSNDKN